MREADAHAAELERDAEAELARVVQVAESRFDQAADTVVARVVG